MSDDRRLPNSSCPICHIGMLLERTNRTTGNKFLGCSEWPKCKYTCGIAKSIDRMRDKAMKRPRPIDEKPFSEIFIDEAAPYLLTPGERKAIFDEPSDPKEIRELVDGKPEPPPELAIQDLLLHMTRVLQEIDARLSIVEDKLGLSESVATPSKADGSVVGVDLSADMRSDAELIVDSAALNRAIDAYRKESHEPKARLAGVNLGYCTGPHSQADICSPFEPHAKRETCSGWTECTEEDMRRVVSLTRHPVPH